MFFLLFVFRIFHDLVIRFPSLKNINFSKVKLKGFRAS